MKIKPDVFKIISTAFLCVCSVLGIVLIATEQSGGLYSLLLIAALYIGSALFSLAFKNWTVVAPVWILAIAFNIYLMPAVAIVILAILAVYSVAVMIKLPQKTVLTDAQRGSSVVAVTVLYGIMNLYFAAIAFYNLFGLYSMGYIDDILDYSEHSAFPIIYSCGVGLLACVMFTALLVRVNKSVLALWIPSVAAYPLIMFGTDYSTPANTAKILLALLLIVSLAGIAYSVCLAVKSKTKVTAVKVA